MFKGCLENILKFFYKIEKKKNPINSFILCLP